MRLLALLAALALVVGACSVSDSAQPAVAGSPSLPAPSSSPDFFIPPAPADAPSPAPAASPSEVLQKEPLGDEPSFRQLSAQLSELLDFAQTKASGTTGVSVKDDAGRPVLEHYARSDLLPASTMKLVTAAAALDVLGPDYRFVTRVYATKPPRPNGTLKGNLVIVGSGDPVLSTPTYARQVAADRPQTPLKKLAARIARAGITRIEGRIVGDGSLFADEPVANGWRDDYLTSLNASRTSGLTADAGFRLFKRNGALHAEAADDPAQQAAAALHELLADRGVRPRKPPIALRDARPRAAPIATIHSPPLRRLLRYALQHSDNQLADAIFRALGAAVDDATWEGSARAVRTSLAGYGLDWSGIRIADGSGLSRDNRLTADFLTDLSRVMTNGEFGDLWLRIQAVSGRSGTLRGRLRNTLAEARLHAKTGTLQDVRSLAGTVVGPDDRSYHIAVIGNDIASGDDIAAVRRLGDVLALALAADLYDCDGKVAVPDEPGPVPEALICEGS